MLSEEKIKSELSVLGIDIPVVFYEETDSTNTRAKEFAKSRPEKEKTPVLFVAKSQTAGRGRMGRSFVSGGGGIYMSLLIYPDSKGYDTTRATAEAAVAIAKAVEDTTSLKPQIKWVSDIYLSSKKLAGILCEGEMNQDGKFRYLVIGMGINVYKNAISDEISDIATSLEDELCTVSSPSHLCAKVVSRVLNPTGNLICEYRARSLVVGKQVNVIKATESYTAKALEICDDYSLLVERDGKTERLFTGEVSLKI